MSRPQLTTPTTACSASFGYLDYSHCSRCYPTIAETKITKYATACNATPKPYTAPVYGYGLMVAPASAAMSLTPQTPCFSPQATRLLTN
jgi:hypothetical protein